MASLTTQSLFVLHLCSCKAFLSKPKVSKFALSMTILKDIFPITGESWHARAAIDRLWRIFREKSSAGRFEICRN